MKIKQYKDRQEIPKKYTWDLEDLLQGKTLDQLFEKLVSFYKSLIAKKTKKYDSSKTFLNYLKDEDQFSLLYNRFSNYLSNQISQNVVNAKMLAYQEKLSYQFHLLEQEMGPKNNLFFENASKIKKWIQQPEFKDYFHTLKSQLDHLPHRLKKEIETFRLKENRADVSVYQMFSILTNSELKFGYATNLKEKKIKVTNANRLILSKDPDKLVRKTSAIAYRQGFLNHKDTLANYLYQHFKQISTWSEIRNFKSSIEMLIFGDRVDKKLLETLYQNVQKHLDMFKKFRQYHKKFYKKVFKENITKHDYGVDLVKYKSQYSIEETIDIVLNSIQPFGKNYCDVVKKALTKERWVDYMSCDNKRTGAYSIGNSYGVNKKYILMNFDGSLRSVETLAHEMGHSMHSYWSDNFNHIRNASYPIFLAEIASIFNEAIVLDYLLKKSQSKREKFLIHQRIIEGFMATVLRQVEWSNFEFDLYNLIDQGKPLNTYQAIGKLYYQNSQKYTLKKTPFNLDEQYPSIYVPHFYYDFYVYKYAIGQICANFFFSQYQKNGSQFLQTYIDNFLKAGGHDFPLNILKKSGIDLYLSNIYEDAFKIIANHIEEWIKLGKQIFYN